nr:reverse transcriptase domain-containing protein [Tanacetum cinerariifolium]
MIIEAGIGGHCIHRMYVDGGSASEIMYEQCFNWLRLKIKNQLVPATTPLIGFSGDVIWPTGKIQLLVRIRDKEHSALAWMNFVVVRSPSAYNRIIRRPGIRKLQAVPSTAHEMLKLLVEGGVITLNNSRLVWLKSPMEKEELIIYLAEAKETVVLSRPEVAWRLQKWSIELVEYAIHYRPRVSVKGHILADFIVKRPEEDSLDTLMEVEEELPEPWILFMDGSSCTDGSRAGLILTNPEEMEFTYALRFRFDATNNEVEYEALIAWLRIAKQMGVKNLQPNVDSRLVANQVNGTCVTKEVNMIRYLEKVRTLTSSFKAFSIRQVARSENKNFDALCKIASTSFAPLSKQVLVEELKEKSISEVEILAVVKEEEDTWMTSIFEYLTEETLSADVKKERAVRRKVLLIFVEVITADRYKKTQGDHALSISFVVAIRVLEKANGNTDMVEKISHVIDELQIVLEKANGNTDMVEKVSHVIDELQITARFKQLILLALNTVTTAKDFQVHKLVLRNSQQKLTLITSPWPFYKWGIDIAEPFLEGPGKVEFLIVAIDYFTKWIEAKPVATITGNQVKKFMWDNIVCRFGLPGEIISDNGNSSGITHSKIGVRNYFRRRNKIKARCKEQKLDGRTRSSSIGTPNHDKSSNRDTPFALTYGTEAVIPVEIGMPTLRTVRVELVQNNEALESTSISKKRKESKQQYVKQKAKQRWKSTTTLKFEVQVSNRETLCTVTTMQAMQKTQGSWAPNGKDHTKLRKAEALGKGTYKLRDHDEK